MLDISSPVYWYQGLLLKPQHFQLESRFQLSQLHAHTELSENDFWGVNTIKINEWALKENRVIIESAELVFRDGSLVSVPDNANVISRSFDGETFSSGKPFLVFLGIRYWQKNKRNTAEQDNGLANTLAETRFVVSSDLEDVEDLHKGGDISPIQKMHYQVRVFWESELSNIGDYHLIPIARIQKNGLDFSLASDFLPPLLNIHQWPTLKYMLSSLFERLSSIAHQLERYKPSNHQLSDHIDIITLQSVYESAWLVHELIHTPLVHPRKAWSVLCLVYTKLSVYSHNLSGASDQLSMRWPNYLHTEVMDMFARLKSHIESALDAIHIGPEYIYKFYKTQDFFSIEKIDVGVFSGDYQYWLVITGEESYEGIDQKAIKLAAFEDINLIMTRAISGLNLIPQMLPPKGIPTIENALYFEINTQSKFWESVIGTRSLAMVCHEFQVNEATLYVTKR